MKIQSEFNGSAFNAVGIFLGALAIIGYSEARERGISYDELVRSTPNVPKYRQYIELPNGREVQVYQQHGSENQMWNYPQYYVDPTEYSNATEGDD